MKDSPPPGPPRVDTDHGASRRGRRAGPPGRQPGVLFAVYAPFGTDPVLSRHPGDQRRRILQQPLVRALRKVAAQGAHVAALIDLHDDDSWLVEIPAFCPRALSVSSTWKQAMQRPQALAGFLRRAHQRFPCESLVLALEGHGAGFLPEIDGLRITPASTSAGGVDWTIGAGGAAPALPPFSGTPVLPVDSPEAVPVTLPLSTWAVAEALAAARRAGVPAPAVIHFNNCFNMALEHLHAVAPHAGYATGYANYNFFTHGDAYPRVFRRLRRAGSASAADLAAWFAASNAESLGKLHNHPTVGAAIRLADVPPLAAAVDALALAMVDALRGDRATHEPRIRAAIAAALQFDAQGDLALEVPDAATDLGTFAAALQAQYGAGPVHDAAAAVGGALKFVWRYGESGQPYLAPQQHWDFSDARCGLSLLLPDPMLDGLWDWRSPYYLAGRVDPAKPPAMKAQIPFLADRADGSRAPWPLFIDVYHEKTPFKGLLRVPPLQFPVFEPEAKPGSPEPPPDLKQRPPVKGLR